MAIAADVDTIQGIVEGHVWFHLDLDNDILYLQNDDARKQALFGEETPEGFTVLCTDSGEFAGMTVIDYWRQYGQGAVENATMSLVKHLVTTPSRLRSS